MVSTWIIELFNAFILSENYISFKTLSGKTDTPPVECSSRNSYAENALNADADSITSDYTRDKPNSTIDLKVEIHRKNSSESSEEAAQLNKPIVTSINVHEAELVTEHDCEQQFRKKHYGNYYYFQKLLIYNT